MYSCVFFHWWCLAVPSLWGGSLTVTALQQWFSNQGPQTSSISVTENLVRNANSWAHPRPTDWIRNSGCGVNPSGWFWCTIKFENHCYALLHFVLPAYCWWAFMLFPGLCWINSTSMISVTRGFPGHSCMRLRGQTSALPISPFRVHATLFSKGISISLGPSRKKKTRSVPGKQQEFNNRDDLPQRPEKRQCFH